MNDIAPVAAAVLDVPALLVLPAATMRPAVGAAAVPAAAVTVLVPEEPSESPLIVSPLPVSQLSPLRRALIARSL